MSIPAYMGKTLEHVGLSTISPILAKRRCGRGHLFTVV